MGLFGSRSLFALHVEVTYSGKVEEGDARWQHHHLEVLREATLLVLVQQRTAGAFTESTSTRPVDRLTLLLSSSSSHNGLYSITFSREQPLFSLSFFQTAVLNLFTWTSLAAAQTRALGIINLFPLLFDALSLQPAGSNVYTPLQFKSTGHIM